MPNELVTGCQLEKIYPGGVKAIDAVDVAIAPRALTALVGANGAGKTTLLRLLCGALSPSRGEVELLGVRQPAAHRAALRTLQSQVAYVDQDPALDPEMTGLETLRLMAALYRVADRQTTIHELVSRFALADILARPIATYSGGQKRRLHIACALLHSPVVIFLDEPTAGLDAEGARALWAELDRRTQAGATVVLASHDLEELEREAACVIMLEGGRVIAMGSPAALIAEHGRTWLRVTLRRHPDDAATLVGALAALPGFSRASLEGRRLWIQATDFSPRDIGVLLAAIAVEVDDVVVHRKDLAGVYRTLTGHEFAPQKRKGRER